MLAHKGLPSDQRACFDVVIRPLQINFLFPVLPPHLFFFFVVSNKISIIPHSFIIFQFFLNTSEAHKSILYKCQPTCL